MLWISDRLSVPDEALEFAFVRAGGPGGQNVNKVSTAVQLRFDPNRCPGLYGPARARLATIAGRRMTAEGVVVLDARRHRTQEANRRDAIERLTEMLRRSLEAPRPRVRTRPTLSSKKRRVEGKKRRSEIKRGRGPVGPAED